MKKEFFEKGILTVCLAAGMILGSGFCSLAAGVLLSSLWYFDLV